MLFAVMLTVIAGAIGVIMALTEEKIWVVPFIIALIALTFLISVTSKAQDCEDFGRFNSLNKIYRCELIEVKYEQTR